MPPDSEHVYRMFDRSVIVDDRGIRSTDRGSVLWYELGNRVMKEIGAENKRCSPDCHPCFLHSVEREDAIISRAFGRNGCFIESIFES